MKVLLTGGSGFIGSHVQEILQKHGIVFFAPTHRECDWLEAKQVTTYLEKNQPTHLLHLAWYAKHGLFWDSAENIKWKDATLHLVREFGRCGGERVVAAGTCAEYMWGHQHVFNELAETTPQSLYGKMKLQTFNDLEAICSLQKTTLAWGRVFFLYGPGENQARIVPRVILSLLKDQKISLTHGHQVRDYLHVQDVARAFVSVLQSSLQGAVNISSGESRTLKEVFDLIGVTLGAQHRLGYGESPQLANDPPFLVGDCHRLKSTGWTDQISLEEGLAESIAWWKKQLAQGVVG